MPIRLTPYVPPGRAPALMIPCGVPVPLDLARYIFLVKNLRGVFVSTDEGRVGELVSWLSRRFRYRDVGLPPSLVERWPGVFEGRLSGNPFHVLGYPTREALEAAGLVNERLEGLVGDAAVAEALTLSLYYASPVLASLDVYRRLEEAGLILHVVRGPRLGLQDARLHMRIAGYSVLDSLVNLSGRAVECMCRGGCSLKQLLGERRGFAAEDARRYWRISGKGDTPTVAYVDYVGRVWGLSRLCSGEARVLLAMPVLFVLDAAMGG